MLLSLAETWLTNPVSFRTAKAIRATVFCCFCCYGWTLKNEAVYGSNSTRVIYAVPSAFVFPSHFGVNYNVHLHHDLDFDLGYLGDRTSKKYFAHDSMPITIILVEGKVMITRPVITE